MAARLGAVGPLIITIGAVLFTDLLKEVGLGLVLGFFFILKDNAKAGSYLRHLRLPEAPYHFSTKPAS